MDRIKRARYLTKVPLINDLYLYSNVVTQTEYVVAKGVVTLIEFLETWKTYGQIEEFIKKYFGETTELQEFQNTIDKLIEKKILITESNPEGDLFKEDLIIVGLGNDNLFRSISLEAYTVLKNCSRIVCMTSEDFCRNVLSKINRQVLNLGLLFNSIEKQRLIGKKLPKKSGYSEVAEKFIETALREKNAVFIANGNPFIGEAIPHLIYDIAKQKGLSVKVISGQSSIDQMCIGFDVDPFMEGLAVVNPSNLDKVISSNTPIFIVIIGYSKYGAIGHLSENFDEFLKEELLEIKKKLLEKYPKDHKIYLLNPNGTYSFPLEKLEEFSKFWQKRVSTLYVPISQSI